MHLAGYIAAEDRRPLLDEDARVLHVAIERVDGDGGVLDNDLSGASCGQWGAVDFQGCAGLDEPCGLIRRLGHFLFLVCFLSGFVIWKNREVGKWDGMGGLVDSQLVCWQR